MQWCHGAPGIIPTLLKCSTLSNEKYFLQQAEKLSHVVWQRGLLRKGFSVCHGVAGNAYAFAYLYAVTKNDDYLKKLVSFVWFILDPEHNSLLDQPDNPYSLFEGISGTIWFLMDMLQLLQTPKESLTRQLIHFPLFDL